MEKLVRDGLPVIIARQTGQRVSVAYAPATEMRGLLLAKLVEEAREAQAAGGGEDLLDEMADVFEVLRTIAQQYNGGWEWVVQRADKKAADRGAFALGIVLDAEGNPWPQEGGRDG